MSIITSTRIAIDALGGNQKVATLTGSTPGAVSNWRKTKFPAATYVVLRTQLQRMGLDARDDLWAMRVKPSRRKHK